MNTTTKHLFAMLAEFSLAVVTCVHTIPMLGFTLYCIFRPFQIVAVKLTEHNSRSQIVRVFKRVYMKNSRLFKVLDSGNRNVSTL